MISYLLFSAQEIVWVDWQGLGLQFKWKRLLPFSHDLCVYSSSPINLYLEVEESRS